MKKFALIVSVAVAAIAPGRPAAAAEVRVLTSVALTAALDELKPAFEKASGDKLNIGYSLIADWRKRILAGGRRRQQVARRRPRVRQIPDEPGGAATPQSQRLRAGLKASAPRLKGRR
jgi:hypothetical protein